MDIAVAAVISVASGLYLGKDFFDRRGLSIYLQKIQHEQSPVKMLSGRILSSSPLVGQNMHTNNKEEYIMRKTITHTKGYAVNIGYEHPFIEVNDLWTNTGNQLDIAPNIKLGQMDLYFNDRSGIEWDKKSSIIIDNNTRKNIKLFYNNYPRYILGTMDSNGNATVKYIGSEEFVNEKIRRDFGVNNLGTFLGGLVLFGSLYYISLNRRKVES